MYAVSKTAIVRVEGKTKNCCQCGTAPGIGFKAMFVFGLSVMDYLSL